MKNTFCKKCMSFKLVLVFLTCLILSCGCKVNDPENQLLGRWRLETLTLYMDGVETAYQLKGNNYETLDGEDEYLDYHNKGPIYWWFNEYGERVEEDKNGNQTGSVNKFRIEGDKIYFENPKSYQKLIGKESESKIDFISKNKICISIELTTFSFDSNSNDGKWVFKYCFSKYKLSK